MTGNQRPIENQPEGESFSDISSIQSESSSYPDELHLSVEAEQPTFWENWRTPTILFILTVISTVWVGIADWSPYSVIENCLNQASLTPLRQEIISNLGQGFLYSLYLLGILMAHELGHFLMAKWYGVPATPPLFLPFPFNPIGTLGAVIAMKGNEADKKEIFDIGLAGPLAGLVFAVPVSFLGVMSVELHQPPGGGFALECPLLLKIMMTWFHPEYEGQAIWLSQLTPSFAAAWVSLLVTGLNMMPVSQLDGGHVSYALFGKFSHWIGKLVLVIAIAGIVYTGEPSVAVMVLLLLVVGPEHPPTRDDDVTLGPARVLVGFLSLSIPILCFPLGIFQMVD